MSLPAKPQQPEEAPTHRPVDDDQPRHEAHLKETKDADDANDDLAGHTQNLPKMKRIPNQNFNGLQGELSPILKIEHSNKNHNVGGKPHPEASKLQNSLGKHGFDKSERKDNKSQGKNKNKITQMVIDHEPNTLLELDNPDDIDFVDVEYSERLVATLFEDSEDEEILNTEEEKEVEVALDSGCVKHCFGKEDLPVAAQRKIRPPPPGTKDFIGAGGHGIKRHGSVLIETQQEGFAPVNQAVQAADVTRALHALCQIADTDKEILYTKGEATVVPGGSLSKYLKFCKKLAEYKRRGGLYIGKMKIRVAKDKPPGPPKRQPFPRQAPAR